MKRVPVTVVVLAKNEEKRIESCINSVKDWAGEIIIIDDESVDNTKAIAGRLGARVITKKMNIRQ